MSLNTMDCCQALQDKESVFKLLGAQLMPLSHPCLLLDLQNLLHISFKLAITHIFQQSLYISWQQRWVLGVALNSTILLSTSLFHILLLNTLSHLIIIE